MNEVQLKIKGIVDDYIMVFPEEYKAFVRQQQMMRDGLLNDFASTGGDDAIERKLFDVPGTLYSMFISNLNKDELTYFKSKKGGRWFAKRFKEFRAPIKL